MNITINIRGMTRKRYIHNLFGQKRGCSMYTINSVFRVGSTPSHVYIKPQEGTLLLFSKGIHISTHVECCDSSFIKYK